jgi:hypothetical protein
MSTPMYEVARLRSVARRCRAQVVKSSSPQAAAALTYLADDLELIIAATLRLLQDNLTARDKDIHFDVI